MASRASRPSRGRLDGWGFVVVGGVVVAVAQVIGLVVMLVDLVVCEPLEMAADGSVEEPTVSPASPRPAVRPPGT
ncbi:hypothetical protein Csp2054_05415 [Curtobacterium sp. 'Ferrero']|nr:hypothetical protein Csp2054_05415 [Curtobacterium sp. 'Ferrero']